MSRREKTLALILVGALLTGLWLWWRPLAAPAPSAAGTSPEIPAPLSPTPPRSRLPRLSEDYDWKAAKKDDLLDLVEQTAQPQPDWKRDFDEIVMPGESLVTEARETAPGVFAFTTITPSVLVGSDGSECVHLALKRQEVDLAGNLELQSSPTLIVPPGNVGVVTVFDPEKQRSVSLRPTRVKGNGIRLQGSEEEGPSPIASPPP